MHRYFYQARSASDFIVKREPNKRNAKVFSQDEEIAEIIKDGHDFRLVCHRDGVEWRITNKVHGERRPFSFAVHKSKDDLKTIRKDKKGSGDELFVVRDQLFELDGDIYMLANLPEGKHWNEHVHSAQRYISRLTDFPYTTLSEIDYDHHDLRDKIKRFRGIPVGQASGLAIEEKGHHIHLCDELKSAGLFIAVISYLIYASA